MGRCKEPNYEILLKSAILAYQEDFRELKKLNKKLIDMYWIGDEGNMCVMSDVDNIKNLISYYEIIIVARRSRINEYKWQIEKKDKLRWNR